VWRCEGVGEMTKEQAVALLLQYNPASRAADVAMYAASFISYLEAEDNINRNGAIVAHPRTGSPMENPYLRVRAAAMKEMQANNRLQGLGELWKAAGAV